MSHWMVEEAINRGAIPLCPVDHRVGGPVVADVRGQVDPGKFGHQWLDPWGNGPRFWCVTQVLPAETAEEEEQS